MTALDLASTLVQAHEGCKLTAYQDIAGVWTIGWGHTGPEVCAGLVWTQSQADAQLASDLAERASQAAQVIHTPLTDSQNAALYDFVYNLGIGSLRGSQLLTCVNSRQWIPAAHQFVSWDHSSKVEVKGLLIRRLNEAALFLRGSPN